MVKKLKGEFCEYQSAEVSFDKNSDDLRKNQRKRLQPGKVSPPLSVPDHIPKPPYVKSRLSPAIARGPQIHDEQGMECMRASGRLAAQVLEYAGTLIKHGQMWNVLNFDGGKMQNEADSELIQ
ncbi:hypothetical protein HPP92_013113 [Vanilla planifolia]|uniref:Methionine aminopeptidase n=1 Tax=Vanilla planifolia TaxID=51239 RepID=A0A835UW60_VANPL|nr:hypothetical protein HPP92_013113 [Vanilla planifolia]